MLEKWLGGYAPQLYAVMRVIVGLLFSLHGMQKLFGWFGGVEGEPVPILSVLGLAGILEFFGGLLVALGFLAGTVAFILSGQMAVAYFNAHFPLGFWPIVNVGELAVLYCFVFLYMASRGSGVWSIDAAVAGRRG